MFFPEREDFLLILIPIRIDVNFVDHSMRSNQPGTGMQCEGITYLFGNSEHRDLLQNLWNAFGMAVIGSALIIFVAIEVDPVIQNILGLYKSHSFWVPNYIVEFIEMLYHLGHPAGIDTTGSRNFPYSPGSFGIIQHHSDDEGGPISKWVLFDLSSWKAVLVGDPLKIETLHPDVEISRKIQVKHAFCLAEASFLTT
jgi:hypothetical protein